MRRWTALPLALGLTLIVGACGPAQVVVTMELDVPDPEGTGMVTRPLEDVEVQLIPFDRDQIFDSMSAAFGTPEPPIPQDLLDAREQVRQAQEAWQQAESRWATIRDTLQKISETMEQYSVGESRYAILYREFQDFDGQLDQVERAKDRAFARFNELQQGTIRRSDSIAILKSNWADEAFDGVDAVFLAAQRATGLPRAADTTDASGVAREHLRVPPGRYWVNARYELPYTELYWNLPIDVTRGDPVQVRLTRENAEERIKL